MSPRSPLALGSAPVLRAAAALLFPLLLAGCPYLGEQGYTDKVRDVDGDGLIAERFGGIDCDDANPRVGDCDADGDGFRSPAGGGADCDDDNALVNPEGLEVCDGLDNDCDGLTDNEDDLVRGPTVWRDVDGDGWGTEDDGILWCGDPPAGYAPTTRSGDCNDDSRRTYPGAPEDCAGVDRNCDGDPTLGAVDGLDWYADLDGDGHGSGSVLAKACEAPSGDLVASGDDCAPNDPDVHPSATEVPYNGIDDDCLDGDLIDVDGDGDDATAMGGTDCDDNDIAINGQAVELCNGIDDDCDGGVDEGLLITTYPDLDGDQFGDPLGLPETQCGDVAVPAGRADNNDDCADDDTNINPSIAEVCDDVDNNCDGEIDGALATDAVTRWADEDGDLYGDPLRQVTACEDDLPTSLPWTDNDLDCDDLHATANPAAAEVCDTLDNDCDGLIDNGEDRLIYFVDDDTDGFGDPLQPIQACLGGEGLSRLGTDCDDADPDTYPGAPEVCGDAFRQDCSTADPADCDADGELDLASGGVDCDDTDPAVGTFAREVCDGLDNDCDGDFDDDDDDVVLATRADWYEDLDGDGVGSNVLLAASQCSPPADSVRITGDCDDTDPSRTPGALEACDSIDNDCDGLIDEDVSDGTVWYADADGDGFGDQGTLPIAVQCEAPAQPAAPNADDCNDALAVVSPDAEELCDGIDNDCDGLVDDNDADVALTVWYLDADGDGYGDDNTSLESCEAPASYVVDAGDCDDTRADRAPGSDELCDGLDNDCDGLVDGDDPDESEPSIWYADLDGDGFGDPNDFLEQCLRPNGYVENAADCDDTSDLTRPGALELCDGVDNDCDLVTDEAAADAGVWFFDEDGDGWGAIDRSTLACSQPTDHVALSGDCDDEEAGVRPGATEVCGDGIDNDCNGLTDDADPGAELLTWYPDLDGDGSGDADGTGVAGCTAPPADPLAMSIPWAPNNEDCDDTDASIGPHADEVCDTVDNDCDGLVDSQDGSVDAPVRFLDTDGDGYGVGSGAARCELEAGWSDVAGDCNDGDASVSPGAVEVCNGTDNDCDGQADDGATDGATWVLDGDGDGFHRLASAVLACASPGPSWQVATGAERDDCDDADAGVNDDAPEVCDGVDNDCNGLTDESGGLLWSVDADGDGYGDPLQPSIAACTAPPGYVSNALDCMDQAGRGIVPPERVFPGQVELCNGIDDDCNGSQDDGAADAQAWYADGDNDGIAPLDATPVWACFPEDGLTQELGDCDDTNPAVSPNAVEQCDTPFDDDCNGLANDSDVTAEGGGVYYADFDGDGFGRPSITRTTCSQPVGFVANADDCDDAADYVSPGVAEVCDGLDNDCSGDLPVDERDGDNDGYLSCTGFVDRGLGLLPGDCDDGLADAFPGAPEQCNQIDDDCNGFVDDLVSNQDFWPDSDGDGFGDGSTEPVSDCVRPEGFVANAADCDDDAGAINPLATEFAGDNVDQNCDGVETCFADADNDDYRDNTLVPGGANGDADCDDPFEGLSTDPVDCNDADGGLTVDALWYPDCDGDTEPRSAGLFACGAADATASYGGCADGLPPDGGSYATQGSDCNDEDPTASSTSLFYPDCDGDSFATSNTADRVNACGLSGANAATICVDGLPPNGGWSGAAGLDCNDEDGTIRPGAGEILGDGIDQDCDGAETCFADDDDDGARSAAPAAVSSPDGTCSLGGQALASAPIDCDDLDPTGQLVEPWYVDCDVDGAEDPSPAPACGETGAALAFASCGNPAATYTSVAPSQGDCADTDPLIFPGAVETPGDSVDQDCDNTELCFTDADNDDARLATTFATPFGDTDCFGPLEGQATDPLDCDDSDPAVRPGAPETVADGVDQDCDGADACWTDADNDGVAVGVIRFDSSDLDCDDPGEGTQAELDAGPDCNDVDPTAFALEDWYVDCDDDGVEGGLSANVCGQVEAELFLGCLNPSAIYTTTAPATADCDDTDPTGQVVEDWWADCDGDTHYDTGRVSVCGASSAIPAHAFTTCFGPNPVDVTTTDPGVYDCNEFDPSIFPGAIEGVGDSIDQDCSNTELCYTDADDDGFRLVTNFETGAGDTDCFGPFEGEFIDGIDCDDTDPAIRPGGFEIPADGIDQSCSGGDDCWTDVDNDGYAIGIAIASADLDCDDDGEGTQVELDLGGDCNDDDPLAQMFEFYAPDCDGDGSAQAYVLLYACGEAGANAQNPCVDGQPPDGGYYTGEPGFDCNDDDPTASSFTDFYPDCDGDGVTSAPSVYACGENEADLFTPCADVLPPDGGWGATDEADCNDEDPAWFALQEWWPDCDSDGAFDALSVGFACTLDQANAQLSACINAPLTVSEFTTTFPAAPDCNDTLAAVYPGAPEVCDGWANDCDVPTLPPDEHDDDFDGFIECGPYVENGRFLAGGGDCFDTIDIPESAALFPGQVFDLDVWTSYSLQLAIDTVCDDATILPATSQTYGGIDLPSTKVVRIDGAGRGAVIDSFDGSPGVRALGTPLGTEVRNLDVVAYDEYAFEVFNGDLLLDNVLVFGSGETEDKGVFADSSTVVVRNSVFDGTLALFGSAVLAQNGSDVTLENTDVIYAAGINDASIYADGSTLTLLDVRVENANVFSSGQVANAIATTGSDVVLRKVFVGFGFSGDRQPSILLTGGTADLEDVLLYDNPGGLWLAGDVDATARRLNFQRSGGNNVLDNYEGAIELRDTAKLTATNVELYDNAGPGIHLRDASDVTLDYATLVGNEVAGIALQDGNLNLAMSHVVFHDHPTDVDESGPYANATNHVLRFEHGTSAAAVCDDPFAQDCIQLDDPEFITYFQTLDSTQWLLRPRELGPLWNGALPFADAGFDPTPIVGHAGGADAAPDWYADTDIDGMPDGWERHWFRLYPGPDLTFFEAAADWDTDGLTDEAEFAAGSSPDNPDTDFDSSPDDSDIAPLDCSVPFGLGCGGQ